MAHITDDRNDPKDINVIEKSFVATINDFIKFHCGPGMFVLGMACKHAGVVLGPVMVLAVALLMLNSYSSMVRISKVLWGDTDMGGLTQKEVLVERYKQRNYHVLAKTVFEECPYKRIQKLNYYISYVVRSLSFGLHLGHCIINFVFIAYNIRFHFEYKYGWTLSVQKWILIAAAAMLVATLITSIRALNLLYSYANIMMNIVFILTYFCVLKPEMFDYDVPKVGDPLAFSFAFTLLLYAFGNITYLLPLRCELKTPPHLEPGCSVINVGLFYLLYLYISLSVLMYLRYGSAVHESITYNFPLNGLGDMSRIIACLTLVFQTPLHLHMMMATMIDDQNERPYLLRISVKLVCYCIAVGFAYVLPYLQILMAMIGSIFVSPLTLILPPILELLMINTENYYPRLSCLWFRTLLFCIFGIVVSISVSIQNTLYIISKI